MAEVTRDHALAAVHLLDRACGTDVQKFPQLAEARKLLLAEDHTATLEFALNALSTLGNPTVYMLVSGMDENPVALHRTRVGAEEHRNNFTMPSWIEVQEWTLED